MTRILAIDTSTAWCSVALSLGGAKTLSRHERIESGASQLLLPWIDELLQEANLVISDLDAIAIGIGPGAFTGVRLGVAVAQGLAVAANLPVIPIVSVDAIASQLITHTGFESAQINQFTIAIDARMDEVYWAKYQHNQQDAMPTRLGDIHLGSPESINLDGVQYLAGSAIHVYGNRLFSEHQLPADRLNAEIGITAIGVLQCAIPMLSQGRQICVHDLEPLYVRNKVAFTTIERELGLNKSAAE